MNTPTFGGVFSTVPSMGAARVTKRALTVPSRLVWPVMPGMITTMPQAPKRRPTVMRVVRLFHSTVRTTGGNWGSNNLYLWFIYLWFKNQYPGLNPFGPGLSRGARHALFQPR